MKLQIVSFTNLEDVMKYNSDEKRLILSLTFESAIDRQTRFGLKCDSDDPVQALGLGTDALYCEGKIIDAPYTCDLARFHTFLSTAILSINQTLKTAEVIFCVRSCFVKELEMNIRR